MQKYFFFNPIVELTNGIQSNAFELTPSTKRTQPEDSGVQNSVATNSSLSNWMNPTNRFNKSYINYDQPQLDILSSPYQLLAQDIYVGFAILNEIQIHAENKIIFFLGTMEQEQNTVKDFIENNSEKLCFAVMHIDKNHFYYLFSYTVNQTSQLLIIDPAPYDQTKENNKQKILSFFNQLLTNQANIEYIPLTQQKDGRACGIACLKTGEDAIKKGAIVITNNKLTLIKENLSLDASRPDFEETIQLAREDWEDRLSQEKQEFAFYADGTYISLGDYQFNKNKRMQALHDHTKWLQDSIIQDINDKISKELSSVKEINNQFHSIEKLIKSHPNFQRYEKEVNELLALNNSYPQEDIQNENYGSVPLIERLVNSISQLHAERYQKIMQQEFLSYLIKNNPISSELNLFVDLDILFDKFKQQKLIATIFTRVPTLNDLFLPTFKNWIPHELYSSSQIYSSHHPFFLSSYKNLSLYIDKAANFLAGEVKAVFQSVP